MKSGGRANYDTSTQQPDDVRARLRRVGLEPEKLENDGKLTITDWYTATLGQKSKEKYAGESLKVADQSIHWSQMVMRGEPEPDMLRMEDDESTYYRFADEKAFMEFTLTRMIPAVKLRKQIGLYPLMRGVHSEWVYRRWEGVSDAVIDFKLDEVSDPSRNLMRIRSMRDVRFDGSWHKLKIRDNFEVMLE